MSKLPGESPKSSHDLPQYSTLEAAGSNVDGWSTSVVASTDGGGNKANPTNRKQPRPLTKPKRPLTAYNLFFQLERQVILRSMSPSNSDDGTPKENQGTETEAPQSCESSQKNTDPDLPARYRDIPFPTFGTSVEPTRRKHRKSHGKIGFKELSQKISSRWSSLDEASKAYFKAKAAEALEVYKAELKVYEKLKEEMGDEPDDKKQKVNQHEGNQRTSMNSPRGPVGLYPGTSEAPTIPHGLPPHARMNHGSGSGPFEMHGIPHPYPEPPGPFARPFAPNCPPPNTNWGHTRHQNIMQHSRARTPVAPERLDSMRSLLCEWKQTKETPGISSKEGETQSRIGQPIRSQGPNGNFSSMPVLKPPNIPTGENDTKKKVSPLEELSFICSIVKNEESVASNNAASESSLQRPVQAGPRMFPPPHPAHGRWAGPPGPAMGRPPNGMLSGRGGGGLDLSRNQSSFRRSPPLMQSQGRYHSGPVDSRHVMKNAPWQKDGQMRVKHRHLPPTA